jgi:hypothetical protein
MNVIRYSQTLNFTKQIGLILFDYCQQVASLYRRTGVHKVVSGVFGLLSPSEQLKFVSKWGFNAEVSSLPEPLQ